MARQVPPSDGNGNLEIVIVRLNGSNFTLQEAIKTVATMANRPSPPARPAAPALPPKPTSLPSSNGSVDGSDEYGVDPEVEVISQDGSSESPTPATPPPARPRKPPQPKLIPDLDFNSASPTLRDFATQQRPANDFDWYLLVAAWLKKHKGLDEIGIDHIYTAKRYMAADWSPAPPADLGQPFRDARRTGLFVKGSKNGLSKITSVGEDRVDRMGQS